MPLPPGQKGPPLIRNWPELASSDPEQIREWWAQWPNANVGGLCNDKWLVIDVDVKDGKGGAESIERLQFDYGQLPSTREHVTPTGGWHYIYRRPDNWAASKISDLPGYPGVDIQVGNAMVVLPPSRTAQGEYTLRNTTPVADGPLWLMGARTGATGKGQTNPHSVGAGNADIVIHQRDNELYRMASLLRRQGHSEKAVAMLLREAAGNPDMYPTHSRKPDRDIDRIVKSAFRHPAGLFDRISVVDDSDMSNSNLLHAISEGEVLWHDSHGSWFEWTGTHWRKSGYRLRQLTAEAIEALWSAWHVCTDDDQRKKIQRRVRAMSTWSRLFGAWEFLKFKCWVEEDEFDANPWLLNCPNGTLDLRTGHLGPHDPANRITHTTRAEWDPDADMSEWHDFVLWCCKGDDEQARWLQVTLGQSLIGRCDEDVMLFLYGSGNNGKSVLTQAVLQTLGTYGHEAPVGLVASKGRDSIHDEYLVALAGRRFVVCPEPSKGTHWADGMVKQLTGGDGISCRPNYGKPMVVHPQFLLVVHGNNRPEVRDRSGGFRRRMRLVPFDNRVQDADRVTNLEDVLAGPGVLRWLVEGARTWIDAQRLPVCARVDSNTQDYLTHGNQISRFIDDMLEFDSNYWTSTSDLYASYRAWCGLNGETFQETSSQLMEQMQYAATEDDGDFKIRACVRKRGGRQHRGWQGVAVADGVAPLETI